MRKFLLGITGLRQGGLEFKQIAYDMEGEDCAECFNSKGFRISFFRRQYDWEEHAQADYYDRRSKTAMNISYSRHQALAGAFRLMA
jgi:hypothetical protein